MHLFAVLLYLILQIEVLHYCGHLIVRKRPSVEESKRNCCNKGIHCILIGQLIQLTMSTLKSESLVELNLQ